MKVARVAAQGVRQAHERIELEILSLAALESVYRLLVHASPPREFGLGPAASEP